MGHLLESYEVRAALRDLIDEHHSSFREISRLHLGPNGHGRLKNRAEIVEVDREYGARVAAPIDVASEHGKRLGHPLVEKGHHIPSQCGLGRGWRDEVLPIVTRGEDRRE